MGRKEDGTKKEAGLVAVCLPNPSPLPTSKCLHKATWIVLVIALVQIFVVSPDMQWLKTSCSSKKKPKK